MSSKLAGSFLKAQELSLARNCASEKNWRLPSVPISVGQRGAGCGPQEEEFGGEDGRTDVE